MRYLSSLLIASLASLVLAGERTEPTPAQMAIVNAHLQLVGVKGQVPAAYVHVQTVAQPREGQIALAVLYTHEDPQGTGGNTYDQKLAVFLKKGKALSTPIDIVAGGKGRRGLKLRDVAADRVVLDSMGYAPEDALCCPSIPGVVTYHISASALVEAGSPNNRMQRSGSP